MNIVADTLRANGANGGRYDKHPLTVGDTPSERFERGESYFVEDFENGTLTSETGRTDRKPLVSGALTGRYGKGVNSTADEGALVPVGSRNGDAVFTFESRVARNGRGAPSDTVSALKAQAGGTGKGDAAPLIAHTLRAEGFDASEDGTGRGTPLVPAQRAFSVVPEGGQGADLRASEVTVASGISSLNEQAHDRGIRVVQPLGSTVRRLSPVECCRLQGFPDDWLGGLHEQPDGPRYAAMGNAVTVPVAEWIGRRLASAGHPESAL